VMFSIAVAVVELRKNVRLRRRGRNSESVLPK
jgi:hypothetical protein